MRFPPCSRRGTWLLAGAAWCAACTGLWWALPAMPRGILRLPHNFDLLTVLPGGERGIVARRIRGEFGHYDLADFELVELPSGRTIKRLPNCGLPLDSFNVWKSCGSVLVRYGDKEDEQWCLLNLRDFMLTKLSADGPEFHGWACRPSRDARFGVTSVDWDKPEIRIWDMHSHRLRGKLPGFRVPYGFAVGQSLLAATSFPEPDNKVSVIELESLSISATFNGPEDCAIMACFSDDERYLVVAFAKVDEWGHYFPPFPLMCWDLSTGQVENRVGDLRDQPTAIAQPGSFVLVTQHYALDGSPLNCTRASGPGI